MIFDLDRHKIRVAMETFFAAVGGGAFGAIGDALMGYFSEPPTFDPYSPASWRGLTKAAIGGAIGAAIYLFRKLPRNPAASDRRHDAEQVEEAASKLVEQGAIPPIMPKKP